MTTFLLIRHAINDAVGKRIAGWSPGLHLNAEGRAQAERLAGRVAHLPIRAIYSSPLERARETADALARRLKCEVSISDPLGELDFGEWTGRELSELEPDSTWQRFNSFRSGTRIPGGELMIEVQSRLVVEVDRLRRTHMDDTIAVVSHGDVIRAAIAYFLGLPLDFILRFEISPASVSILSVGDNGPYIQTVNSTGELW